MELVITKKNNEKFTVLYDKCDQNLVNSHSWHINAEGYVGTAIRGEDGKWRTKLMHRLILGVTDPKIEVDHKNHNRIDNRRENIRTCTKSENQKNITPRGRSKYLGVSYDSYTTDGIRYTYIVVQIKTRDGKKKKLRGFKNEEDAARAYDELAKVHHGEFANLNFP